MQYESRERVERTTSFEPAGDPRDIFEAQLVWSVAEELKLAQVQLRIASLIASSNPTKFGRTAANRHARASLRHFRAALDFAEDSGLECVAHELMDRAGNWVRRAFGCPHVVRNSSIEITCPLKLGHTRIGVSVGIRIKQQHCQFCGLDPSECSHMPGESYWVPGGSSELGWCRVCGDDCCSHSEEREYRVPLNIVVTEAEIDEISLVTRPAMRVTRIERMSESVAAIEEVVGHKLPDGSVLSCDSCLSPCEGLIRPELN